MSKNRVALKSLKHDEATKKNLPTIENEGFVPEAIKVPKEVDYPRTSLTLYPRNAAADPQLVWRGKDEQDADGDLAVRALPIYVHEHITPLKIVQSLIADSEGRALEPELFERDFNGLSEEQRLQFYQYDEHWTNRMILGDSLSVMASLSEKEQLRGRVQMVYMDPPYGVDFKSNWQVATNKREVRDGKPADISAEPEQIKAYRDTWKDGVHSYLAYLRDRVSASHDLLNERGSLFVQISDDRVHLVRCILDEVFGSDNFISLITFKKTSGAGSFSGGTTTLASTADYLLWYAKNRNLVKYRQLFTEKSAEFGVGEEQYTWIETTDGRRIRANAATVEEVTTGRRFTQSDLTSVINSTLFPDGRGIEFEGRTFSPAGNRGWSTNQQGMAKIRAAGRLIVIGNNLRFVRYLDDFPAYSINNVWDDTIVTGFASDKRYVVQTSPKVVERCVLMSTDPGDLVLDPTCGGGTTAFCAEKWGRRWITIDTSKVALMLTRERLLSSKYPYFVLLDSHEGRVQEARLSAQPIPMDLPPARANLSHGFVYERAARIGLKSVANNPDIVEGMARDEIDRAIRRHAELAYFFDKPIVDKTTVRVAGPFTVESLAPTAAQPLSELIDTGDQVDRSQFVGVVLDNLQTSGISNGDKGGRIRFASVEPFPGEYINAVGITPDSQRYAIAVGPKEGTVGKRFIIDAGREALDEALADALAVCGFAFEDAAQTERLGSLLVLKVRMNQDLQLADLLKKSKTANLFQVYGEPDVLLECEERGCIVTVKGMDVFDPAKREIRSAGTDKIQAWFLDTNYDGERFIVRHTYFLGDDDVFDDLKRALKGEIDAEAWRSLYSDRSRPFPKPGTGKIAVKVITVFGDEAIVILKAQAEA